MGNGCRLIQTSGGGNRKTTEEGMIRGRSGGVGAAVEMPDNWKRTTKKPKQGSGLRGLNCPSQGVIQKRMKGGR